MGVGAGLGHVHRVASHLQPSLNDVVEVDQHADLTLECDPQHAVEVRIGDQEAATVSLQRELESGRDDTSRAGNDRRIVQIELADVRDDGKTVWTIHSVDAVNVAAADVRANEGDQCVRNVVDERDVDRPTDAQTTDGEDRCRQTAGERRFLPGLRIDSRDPAGSAFGDLQRTIGADGAAHGTL